MFVLFGFVYGFWKIISESKKNKNQTPAFCDMLLAGLPSARADQKTIDTRVSHSDVLVRALGLDGLHKHKARRCNQHSQKKLRLCLMRSWTAPLCHCQRDGKKKTTTVVSVVDEGGPPAHSLWYAILDVIRDAHMALWSLSGSSPGKEDMSRCNIWLEGFGKRVLKRKGGDP